MVWWHYVLIFWALCTAFILFAGYRRAKEKEAYEAYLDRTKGKCRHNRLSAAQWTQDGYVRICMECGGWNYLGESDG